MDTVARKVEYYYASVKDQPGMAYKILESLQQMGVNQLAFAAIPIGPEACQLAIFPEDPAKLTHEAQLAGLQLSGPYHAFLVQGADKMGALVELHQKLFKANVNVYASTGVTDGKGNFGYLIYVKEDDFKRAAEVLGI
ncbi:MAG: hypothetical protein ABFR97_07925 [Thermodesulfobacteriota bacterium]